MKFKAFTLLKNLKFSPETTSITSMEAVTEKKELKQEDRKWQDVLLADKERKGNSIGAEIQISPT